MSNDSDETPSGTATFEASLIAHSSKLYNKHANFVYSDESTGPVLRLLNAQPGERILDIGCGSGELTHKLEEIVGDTGVVWGVDSNAEMLRKSRESFPTLDGRLFQSDCQELKLPSGGEDIAHSFDAVFSSAVLHWCKRDPGGVFDGVKSLLKPGGRFVGEMGGFLNMISVRSHIHQVLRDNGVDPSPLDPWHFPTTDFHAALLAQHGFKVVSCSLHPRITPLPTDLEGWLFTFARTSFFSGFNDEQAGGMIKEVAKRCEVDCRDEQGRWTVMYMRLRWEAVLEG